MSTTAELQPAAAETCTPEPHAWAAHLGGTGIHIEICYLCKAINWDGIREQTAALIAAERKRITDGIAFITADLDGTDWAEALTAFDDALHIVNNPKPAS